MIGRVVLNEALTSEQKTRHIKDLSEKHNSKQSPAIQYDQCDMFITMMEDAVDLMRLLLHQNPLSEVSVAKPQQDAQKSPAPQAEPDSPLDGAAPNSLFGAVPISPLSESAQGSTDSQDQAGAFSGAVLNSPANGVLTLDQAGTADPSPSNSTTPPGPTSGPPPSSPLTPAGSLLSAKAAGSDLDVSSMVTQEPLDKHAQLGHLDGDALGQVTSPIWKTPSAAAWKQISTMAARAVLALEWVSQLRTDTTEAAATACASFKSKLVQLLLQLLQGHFGDTTLDFQPVLHQGIAPVVGLLKGASGGGPNLTLATLFLERMRLDAIDGRLPEGADEHVRSHQIRTILALLGKLTGATCPHLPACPWHSLPCNPPHCCLNTAEVSVPIQCH